MFWFAKAPRSLNIFKQLPAKSKRFIVNIAELRGMLRALPPSKRHFSPLVGAIFSDTDGMKRFYELAIMSQNPSATHQLTTSIFHKLDIQFRATYIKTNPAYSLNPELLAEIMYYLDAGLLLEKKIRQEIFSKWNRSHLDATGSKNTNIKMSGLLDLIVASKNECLKQQYPIHFTETILLSFLCFKASTRQELKSFLCKLDSLSLLIDTSLLIDDAQYSDKDIERGKKVLSQLGIVSFKMLIDEYAEDIILSYRLRAKQLRRVIAHQYGFKDKPQVPNCVEASIHNLCNILLYNNNKYLFDFSLLPSNLKPNEKFILIYSQNNFSTSEINSNAVGQRFMNILSDHNNFIYSSGNYELKSTKENFIPVMNFLFGSTATSLEELSNQFSHPQRTIQFIDHDQYQIHINIKSDHAEKVDLFLHFKDGHAHLLSPANHFDKHQNNTIYLSPNLIDFADKNIVEYPILFTLVDYLYNGHFHIERQLIISPETINYLMIYHVPRYLRHTYRLLLQLMPYLESKPEYENYALYLIAQFDNLIWIPFIDATEFHSPYNANIQSVLKIISLCFKAGINSNLIDDRGTPLLIHAKTIELVNLVLENGANPNVADKSGKTPLHYCSHISIMKALLNAGAKLDVADNKGNTALHDACFNGNTSKAIALFKAGADLTIENKNKVTPYSFLCHFKTGDRTAENRIALRDTLFKLNSPTGFAFLKRDW